MKPMIVVLTAGLLAGCGTTAQQQTAEQAQRTQLAETIIQACERSGYPRGTAENIQCATELVDRIYPASGGGMTGAEAAYGAYTSGWAAGDRVRSGIPEPPQRLIITPY